MKTKIKGFMATTHILIALLTCLLILLIPLDISKFILNFIHSSKLNMLMFFIIICGACFLPDMDGEMSYAGFQLGLLGKIISHAMIVTSYMVTSIFKMKKDKPPESQHRKLWHRPDFIIILFGLMYIFFPKNEASIIDLFKQNGIKDVLLNHSLPIIIVLIGAACVHLGVNGLIWRINFILPYKIQKIIKIVLILLGLFYLVGRPINDLRYISLFMSIGYLSHLFGDLFTQGSIPLANPFKKQLWWTPWILGPFQIYTGGIINKILDMVLFLVDIYLIYIIIVKGSL